MSADIDKWVEDNRVAAFSELENSVGYYESAHKDEVTKGAKILWMKMEPRFREMFKLMQSQAGYDAVRYEAVKADLKTLADIVRRHS